MLTRNGGRSGKQVKTAPVSITSRTEGKDGNEKWTQRVQMLKTLRKFSGASLICGAKCLPIL